MMIMLPVDAEHVQVITTDESTITRWMQNCCDSESHGDTWEVSVTPSRHHVKILVEYGDGRDGVGVGLLDAVKTILKHQSGVSVDIAMRSKAA